MKPLKFPTLLPEGERLRTERRRLGLTQAEIAEAGRVSATTVSRIERGLIARHERTRLCGAGELAFRVKNKAFPNLDADYVATLVLEGE